MDDALHSAGQFLRVGIDVDHLTSDQVSRVVVTIFAMSGCDQLIWTHNTLNAQVSEITQ